MHPNFFILLAVTIGVAGQLLIKLGLNSLGKIDFSHSLIGAYAKMFCSPFVFGGIFTYVISIFLWLYALTKVDLSFAYPFLASSYVMVLIASWFFLGESIGIIRWIGVAVICIGVFLVSRS
jgi:drug/metabolite transporter (DMT)-like permease